MTDVATRAGSPKLSAEREQEILRAAYALLAEVGYDALRLDAVAARARASKATLYRHWTGKAKLVADAVRCCNVSTMEPPDTGTLRGDLLALLGGMAESIASDDGPIFAGLVMAMRCDQDLAAEMRALQAAKRPLAQAICSRAVSRGELPAGCAAGLVEEIAPAQIFMHHFARGEPLDERFITHLVDDILLPLLSK
jgi:AcrR family transcriptional regulator